MNKKLMMLLSAILVVVLGVSGITFALLNAQSQVKSNEFHPGVLTARIVENGEEADHEEELTPDGDQALKEVQVLNVNNPHEVDAYIRVMLVPTFRTSEGSLAGNVNLTPDNNKITVGAPNGGTVTLTLDSDWEDHWIFHNGYFYHRSIVHPGHTTEVLLDSVGVSDTGLWDTFQLEVLSDAVQAESGAAENAWGVTITDNGELSLTP